jgi:MutS domain V
VAANSRIPRAPRTIKSKLPLPTPREHYETRLAHFRDAHALAERRFRNVGAARVAALAALIAVGGIGFGPEWFSPWWLIAPAAVSIALTILHDRVEHERSRSSRGIAFHERALARLAGVWIGSGNPGDRFRDPKHVYADDLDLFGRGSLFEFLSTARSGAGESTLASWLLSPGARDELLARQQSVEELRPRADLREDLALVGDDVRAAIDAGASARWGTLPPAGFFRGARALAFILAAAAIATLILWLAHVVILSVFLAVLLVEIGFWSAIRQPVDRVSAGVAAPGKELRLLVLLLERLEREDFISPRLAALKRELGVGGHAASRRIKRLSRLTDNLDSARNSDIFRAITSPLLWIPQFAMAIESWRRESGPRIGAWIAAIGEFEALCSLAAFAYERPGAIFPELTGDHEPLLHATAMHHPLIPPASSIPNDVSLGDGMRLWIVSGSNMSGKSTLLRAVGLNAVLAWAGAPVPCASLRISRLAIGASLRANDSLADNRSRFYAEIERLRDIVNLAREGPTLFLLDELLSGTNSHDRRIGAEALVRGLVTRGAIGMVTTHDLALSKIADTLDATARNVHFEDHLEGGEIRFDYILREGVVTRSNALELMRAVGLDV